jgi:hypothetical protein
LQRLRLLLPGHRRRDLLLSVALAAALAAASPFLGVVGCSDPSDPPPEPDGGTSCKLDYLGDPDQPMVIEPIYMAPDESVVPLADGDVLPLVFPPQGGRVIFVGVRATNLLPCGVKLTGAARDLVTGQVRFDARTMNFVAGADGKAGSIAGDLASFSNVPICPNQWASIDAFDQTFGIEIQVQDRDGKKGEVMLQAKLACAEPANEEGCKCICKEGYTTDQVCNEPVADGGVDGG